jgi:putative nucleotidyltransferase with HDIG domain
VTRIDELRQYVRNLYEEKREERDRWCDWFYENHVFIVGDGTRELAKKYAANPELAEVAGLLHDIADTRMPRVSEEHGAESLNIAREAMEHSGYTNEEIELVVDDAIRYHSCHGDERPKSKEGLVLATADSLAHLKTGFYIYATWAMGEDKRSLQHVKDWVIKKIDRDLYNKISFEDERNDARHDYEIIKELFSRP